MIAGFNGVGKCDAVDSTGLDRQGYDEIARRLYHSPQAIKRYMSTFLRVLVLHTQHTEIADIAFLTHTSESPAGSPFWRPQLAGILRAKYQL